MLHLGAARRAPRGARRVAQVLGPGDRDPRDLGRAVEVVDDVAELVHEAPGQLAGQRGAADRDGPQRVGVVAARGRRRRGRGCRWSITGTIGQRCRPARARSSASTSSGSNLRRSTIVLAVSIARAKWAKPHWWNSGARDQHLLAAAQRDRGEDRDGGADARRAARGALRRAGRARGEDRLAALASGGTGVAGSPSPISSLDRRVADLVVLVRPRHEALAAVQRVRQQLGELRVVDDRARLLALDHLGQLRAGERGVEQHRVGAELGQRDQRLDEPAVVAAHHRRRPRPPAPLRRRARSRAGSSARRSRRRSARRARRRPPRRPGTAPRRPRSRRRA